MKLTNIAIKNAKPQDKPYHLMDGDNLSLLITPIRKTTFYAELKKGNITIKRFGAKKSLVPIESVNQWIESLPTVGGGHA